MQVTLKIDRKGEQPGTLGWLCKNAASINCGKTKQDYAGVWLKDHEDKTMFCLGLRGFFGSCGSSEVDHPSRHDNEMDFSVGMSLTDAAWKVVEEQLFPIAADLLTEPVEEAAKVQIQIKEEE